MLVLARREGESIRIGQDILITVVRLGEQKVRIGIDAPTEVVILRTELESKTRRVDNILRRHQ